jgi:hypothetical protein
MKQLKEYTLYDVFAVDEDDTHYADELRAAFVGHPTLTAKELLEIIKDNMTISDGRHELSIWIADNLLDKRTELIICGMILDRCSYVLDAINKYDDNVSGRVVHCWDMFTYSKSPSINIASDDIGTAVALLSHEYDTDGYWDAYEAETDKHLAIIMEVLNETS